MAERFRWDDAAKRYRNASTGRFAPDGEALRAIVKDTEVIRRTLLPKTAAAYLRGDLTLDAWRARMLDIVKHLHLGAATVAKGGRGRMTDADFGRVGRIIRFHYGKLDAWAQDLASGTAPSDGRMVSRAKTYASATRSTYVAMRTADVTSSGFDQARSITTPGAEHCDECLAEEAKGWQPTSQMVPIGARTCRSNDACRVEFRNSRTGTRIAA